MMRARKAAAFAPSHITGFFGIRDSHHDPLKKGSVGAGVSMSKGVFTKVSMQKGSGRGASIRINGRPSRAEVSRSVLGHFDWTGRLEIDHLVQVPMGSGFGTSGAGALSLALAMNSILGSPMTKLEAAQIAHMAEIECVTGLGTVAGEFAGGFEARTKAGAPGVGKVMRLPIGRGTEVACLWFGPVSKKVALSDKTFRKAVDIASSSMVARLVRTPERFMELSRKFAEGLPGLITPMMRKVLDETDEAGIRCSPMMIGRSLFGLVDGEDKRVLLGIFKRHAGKTVTAKIDFEGARVI